MLVVNLGKFPRETDLKVEIWQYYPVLRLKLGLNESLTDFSAKDYTGII